MSGGVAYVLDEAGDFPANCNMEMVKLFPLEDPAEIAEVRRGGQPRPADRQRPVEGGARRLGAAGAEVRQRSTPTTTAASSDAEAAQAQGLSDDEAVMAAFEENARDLSRRRQVQIRLRLYQRRAH